MLDRVDSQIEPWRKRRLWVSRRHDEGVLGANGSRMLWVECNQKPDAMKVVI